MYCLFNIVLLLLLCIAQSGFDVVAAVAADGRPVEDALRKRVQIRPGQAESSFFKLQSSQKDSEMDLVENPDSFFSPSVAASVTPSKTTTTLHEKRAKTCPAHPLPSGHCACHDQTLCTASGAKSTCVQLASNQENCGACFRRCRNDQACKSGDCVCKGRHLSACGNSCVDLSNNELNCGRCKHVCPSGKTCVSGLCLRL